MSVKRRITIIAAFAVAAAVMLVPSVAMANFSIHGGYAIDTDACAGCHRAHTAASPIQWSRADNGQPGGSALLITTASDTEAFCLTCHGSGMSGADTNVEDGMFEANDGDNTGNDRTYNVAGGTLNGGGFNMSVQRAHSSVDGWWAYGGSGNTTNTALGLDEDGIPQGGVYVGVSCTVCHDVHGSVNYRLLKTRVNGVTVGGYAVDGTPEPFVISSEIGYPTGGWLLGGAAASQVETYYPDYTTPRYAKGPGGDDTKGMSYWCATCHTEYVVTSRVYNANDGFGTVMRHRHPVNVELSEYTNPANGHPSPEIMRIADNPLPLAHEPTEAGTWANQATDWLDCMTCHVAHGSDAVMTGYANVWNPLDPQPDSGTGGVAPANGNALLRGDNRYVCQACHNK